MKYQKVRDIMPELLAGTENGKLKWKADDAEDDFYAIVDSIKIEIEFKYGDEKSTQAVVLYVWNDKHKIIDSDYIFSHDKDFEEFRKYFLFIKQNAFDVSGILNRIVEALK